MSKKGLFVRIIIYLSLFGMLIFSIINKQRTILSVRASTVVSPITEWAKTGKPVDVLRVQRTDFFMFTKLTVEKMHDNQYIGYITQDEKESISLGQKVYYNASREMFCGKVVEISSERDLDKGLFKVIVDLGESKQHLNTRAIVFIQTEVIPSVIQLPNEILDTDGNKLFIYKVVDGILERAYIELGVSGCKNSVIVSGVNEGGLIVVYGSTLTSVGERVFVRKEISQ